MQLTKNGLPLLVGNSWLSDMNQLEKEKGHACKRNPRKSFTPSAPQQKVGESRGT